MLSGTLASAAGLLYATRLGAAGTDTAVGMEVAALTAAVLGGISLGGGRGSITKGFLGALIVIAIQSSLLRLGLRTGANTLVLGLLLLLAVAIDVKWLKVLAKVYVSPAYFALPKIVMNDPASPCADNNKLADVERIGLGEVEGPEGVILDDAGNLNVCVSGIGLYQITKAREVRKLSDETNRSWLSVIDDSRMRFADDLDIAPDGKIYSSEATIRFDVHEWMIDALECRGIGRLNGYIPT